MSIEYITIEKSNKILSTIEANSLLIALFLSLQSFRHFMQIPTAASSLIILLLAIVFNKNLKINLTGFLYFSFVVLWFLISKVTLQFGEDSTTYFLFFIVFGISSLYLTSQNYDYILVVQNIARIHLFISPFIFVSALINGTTMGEAYSLLIGFFSLILCIIDKRYITSPIFTILFTGTLLICVYKFSLVNTRGAYLSILIFLIMYVIVLISKKSFVTLTLISFLFLLGNIINNYFYEILSKVRDVLILFGLELEVINKSIYLLESERFDHNRDWFYEYALNGIVNNIWYGQGIGSFELQTGRVYIHNFILQILFEGGIIYFIPFLIFLIVLIRWMFPVSYELKGKQIFILILSSSTIVKLFFSETYIKDPKFIFLMMITLVTLNLKIKK